MIMKTFRNNEKKKKKNWTFILYFWNTIYISTVRDVVFFFQVGDTKRKHEFKNPHRTHKYPIVLELIFKKT